MTAKKCVYLQTSDGKKKKRNQGEGSWSMHPLYTYTVLHLYTATIHHTKIKRNRGSEGGWSFWHKSVVYLFPGFIFLKDLYFCQMAVSYNRKLLTRFNLYILSCTDWWNMMKCVCLITQTIVKTPINKSFQEIKLHLPFNPFTSKIL